MINHPATHRLAAMAILVGLPACVARDGARDSAIAGTPGAATVAIGGSPNPPPATRSRSDSVTSGPSVPSSWVITPRGLGPVRAGMSLSDLGAALGQSAQVTYQAGTRCTYFQSPALPAGVALMINDDTVRRVDVREKGVRTAEGIQVGDTEHSVTESYAGRVRTTPHKYTGPTGHYLTVRSPSDAGYLIVFETDGSRVTKDRAGRTPEVEHVEGCS